MDCPICKKIHADTVPQALTKFAASSRRLERLIRKMTARQAAAKPAPDKWSAKEIVCHLADCEVAYGLRYRMILSEPGPVLVAFDQDVWARHLRYQKQSLQRALDTFKILRAGHVAMFQSLSRAAWSRAGQHPAYGNLSLRQLVAHMVEHDGNHLAQVERLLPS
jgi:uncharacterized damage-inducible protein DinB